MRRTAAGLATALLAALALCGPLAGTGQAGPAALRCATPAPPEACALLDDLAAQLAPVSSLLGPALAPLTGPAAGFAARSDQPAGVPTGEVTLVSKGLLQQLALVPDPVEALVGPTQLGALTNTLEALVAELAAPVAGGGQQSAAGSSTPTPARASAPAASSGSRSGSTSIGGSSVAPVAPSTGSSTSGAKVPEVPVGSPLALGPLAMPEFTFDPSAEPIGIDEVAAAAAPTTAEDAQRALAESLPGKGPGAELAVVVGFSLLLLAGAGIAQVQANRHVIPD